jgi:hypothetical protein
MIAPKFNEPSEADIQHEAYLLYLASGRAPGRELQHWLTAKELLRHRIAGATGEGRVAEIRFPNAAASVKTDTRRHRPADRRN